MLLRCASCAKLVTDKDLRFSRFSDQRTLNRASMVFSIFAVRRFVSSGRGNCTSFPDITRGRWGKVVPLQQWKSGTKVSFQHPLAKFGRSIFVVDELLYNAFEGETSQRMRLAPIASVWQRSCKVRESILQKLEILSGRQQDRLGE